MGWREINMNRRRPQPSFSAIPVEPGGDRTRAVMRKAAAAAVRNATLQMDGIPDDTPFKAFVASYLLGYAIHVTAKNGVDCKAITGDAGMADLAREIAEAIPAAWGIDMRDVGLPGRNSPMFEAGSLVGRLEARCACAMLLGRARARMQQTGGNAGLAFLTDCDNAADPMLSRLPTMRLRFEGRERDVIVDTFRKIE